MLTSAVDQLRVEIRFADDLDTRVLRMQHGWEEANVNGLSSADLDDLDPISGFPCFRSLPVRLERPGGQH